MFVLSQKRGRVPRSGTGFSKDSATGAPQWEFVLQQKMSQGQTNRVRF
jgi:hypothetical protein